MQRLRPSIIHAIDIFTLGDAGTSGSRTLREGYPVGASTHATGDISLKFKSSLFAGALDGGEDQVFMGESKFKRFMASVEKVADTDTTKQRESAITDAEERDQDMEREPVDILSAQEPAQLRRPVDPDDAAKTDAPAHRHALAPDTVAAAHGFLTALADTFADPRKTAQLMSSFVKTDDTGARRIVIPPDIEHAALRALDAFSQMTRNANAR